MRVKSLFVGLVAALIATASFAGRGLMEVLALSIGKHLQS
jgi:hypothetical protein